MSIQKPFALSAAFPISTNSLGGLQRALDYIKPFDFSMVGYYCENFDAENIRTLKIR